MRAAWGYPGSDPPADLPAKWGITWLYFDIRDSRLTPSYLSSVASRPGVDGCGVYVAASWLPDAAPEAVARWTDARLRQIGYKGALPVMFDIEGMPNLASYCVACLTEWRTLRPRRVTDLTIEGHKGGVFGLPEALAVCKLVRYVVPQAYDGQMHPWDTFAMVADLWAAGFPLTKVCPFYDAAHLLPWWGTPAGFAFTWERLP